MSFTAVNTGTTEYLTAGNIAAVHGFTTRIGGVSQGYLEGLNLGYNRGDDPKNVMENYRILGDAMGFDPGCLVLTRQVHQDGIRRVTKEDHRSLDHRDYPACDGLITNQPGTGLMIFGADCTPILLWDPVTGAVGACHAGWRGTAASIAGKTALAMAREFGCKPENICAAIGPNIGPCCFQTDADVPKAMVDAYGDRAAPFMKSQGSKFYVNLKGLNALSLEEAGVKNIEIAPHCTACDPRHFWSHRKMGDHRGSQGALIFCKEAK